MQINLNHHILVYDLVFLQINITMEPKVLDRVNPKTKFLRQTDMASI